MSLEDDLLEQRIKRTAEIEALGFRAYGQRFDFTHTIPEILAAESAKTAEELAAAKPQVRIAGRIQTMRRMGKAGFFHLMQRGERLQVYVRSDAVNEREYALYQLLDMGDIVGVEGYLFRTRTGELSVHAEKLTFLSKILLSLPEKWHGPRRRRDPLPPALSGSDRESGIAKDLRDARAHHFVIAAATRRARLRRSGDADDAAALWRRDGAALRHASQHARHGSRTCASRRSCT